MVCQWTGIQYCGNNVARNAYTQAAFRAISDAGPGYTLPGSEALRTILQDSMFSHVEAQLQPEKDNRVGA